LGAVAGAKLAHPRAHPRIPSGSPARIPGPQLLWRM
jgi:hypothetical protein